MTCHTYNIRDKVLEYKHYSLQYPKKKKKNLEESKTHHDVNTKRSTRIDNQNNRPRGIQSMSYNPKGNSNKQALI